MKVGDDDHFLQHERSRSVAHLIVSLQVSNYFIHAVALRSRRRHLQSVNAKKAEREGEGGRGKKRSTLMLLLFFFQGGETSAQLSDHNHGAKKK